MLKISIIIATYNSEKTLKQTLDSIRYQTYENIETIVIDGLSTDDTLKIVKEYSDVVKRYISEKDTGIYNAFNKGINLATGDYIVFLGSDDCLINYNVISNVASEIDGTTDMLSAPIICIDENNSEFKFSNKISQEDIFSGKMLPHPGIFVKKGIMLKYKFNENNKIISDYEFLVRYILDGGKIKFIDKPVVYFSLGGISSDNFNGDSWKLNVYEHLRLYQNLNIDTKYLFTYLNNELHYVDIYNFDFIIKSLIKSILRKLSIIEFIKVLLGKKKKHKCNLKYCRWCGRTDSK